jgi:cytochrome b6-f complex iron-sulfur subunit
VNRPDCGARHFNAGGPFLYGLLPDILLFWAGALGWRQRIGKQSHLAENYLMAHMEESAANQTAGMNRRDFVAAAAVAAAGIGILAVGRTSAQTTQPSSSGIDVGAKTDYSKDGPVMTWAVAPNHLIVIRESGKLYATTSKCTHKMCDVKDDGTQFTCPCHNSAFGYDGEVTNGPAKKPLPRYAISVNGDGHVIVDTSKQFATDDTWTDPASFVALS